MTVRKYSITGIVRCVREMADGQDGGRRIPDDLINPPPSPHSHWLHGPTIQMRSPTWPTAVLGRALTPFGPEARLLVGRRGRHGNAGKKGKWENGKMGRGKKKRREKGQKGTSRRIGNTRRNTTPLQAIDAATLEGSIMTESKQGMI